MKKILFSLLLTMATIGAWSANKPAKVYMFGFASSFNDSTVCFTDIQTVDSAYIDSKTKFLYSRENYSYQLRDYLKGKGFITPTCITIFTLKRKDIEKRLAKMRKRYSNGKYIVKDIKSPEFTYQAVKFEE
jgi:hypothetical protein